METIGIVGLGAMGLGIAQVFAQAGFAVMATDGSAAVRQGASGRMRDALNRRVQSGKIAASEAEDTIGRFNIVTDPTGLGAADMVIEAIIEDIHAKRALLAVLEAAVPPQTVIATNTSSLGIGALAEGLHRPERLIGLHFFNPPTAMKLVELAGHAGTDAAALTRARLLAERTGKVVIGCADRPGFIVNRCARPFYGEALAIYEEGLTAAEIDASMLGAGYRMGPFQLIDLIGADVHLAATETIWRAMDCHPRYHVFDRLTERVAAGELGRKTERGFLWPEVPGGAPEGADLIVLRIEAALANEAATLVAEGAVTPADVDLAMRLGMNFPHGPFAALRRHGAGRVIAMLEDLERRAPAHLRGRYTPAPNLEDCT